MLARTEIPKWKVVLHVQLGHTEEELKLIVLNAMKTNTLPAQKYASGVMLVHTELLR